MSHISERFNHYSMSDHHMSTLQNTTKIRQKQQIATRIPTAKTQLL
jgi:hypothetical protein